MQYLRQFLKPFLFISFAISLIACSSDDGPGGCTPLAATSFPCTDPNECLSVTATWCYPGATTCANADVDLTLMHPGSFTIDHNVNQGSSGAINGCIHDGDETGNVIDPDGDGATGPFNENITCDPHLQAMGPNLIDAGTYVVAVNDTSFIFRTEIARLDINVDGQTSCQFVDIDTGPAQVNVAYP